MTAQRRAEPEPARRARLTVVPTDTEVRSFERFLAEWLAEAAERRIRRKTAA